MKNRTIATGLFVVAQALACSSDSSKSAPTLVGSWIEGNASNTYGTGVTFHADGTYVQSTLLQTSATTFDGQIETGIYTSTATTITQTPKTVSCPLADPPYTVNYSFDGANLVIATTSQTIVFVPNTSTGTTSSIAITDGCFDAMGHFTPSPIVQVN